MMSNPPSGLVATDEMLAEISLKIARLEKLLRLARECDFQDAQREIQASLRDALAPLTQLADAADGEMRQRFDAVLRRALRALE